MWNHEWHPLDNLDAAEKNLSEVMVLERITIPMGGLAAGGKNPITLLHKPLIAKLAIPLEKSALLPRANVSHFHVEFTVLKRV